MKVLLDTSVLVAGVLPPHEHHARCLPWLSRAASGDIRLVLAAHSLTECYSVLTSMPLRPRLSPAAAARLIRESMSAHAELVGLTAQETLNLVKDAAAWELAGGVVHDAAIARVAAKAGVDRLITLNVRDFRRAWPGGADRIAAP